MKQSEKIKELEERIKQLENRPNFIPVYNPLPFYQYNQCPVCGKLNCYEMHITCTTTLAYYEPSKTL